MSGASLEQLRFTSQYLPGTRARNPATRHHVWIVSLAHYAGSRPDTEWLVHRAETRGQAVQEGLGD
eukprot:3453020-Rhodomonas_salina.2